MASSSSHFAMLTPDNQPAQKCLAVLVDKQLLEPDQLILSFERLGATRSIDLPVCPLRSRRLKGRILCETSIHPQSGALMLQNLSEDEIIVYLVSDERSDIKLQYQEMHVLHMLVNYFRIGSLYFKLEFCVKDESIQLENNLIIHRVIGQGAFGQVKVAVDRLTGRVVACKTIQGNKPREIALMENELAIAQGIPARAAGLMRLLRSWCDHNQSVLCFQAETERMHLLMPYTPFTFRTAPWRDMTIVTRLALFSQVLEGLHNLHAMNIMHRDISPANLLIFWPRISPPSAVISDYSKVKRDLALRVPQIIRLRPWFIEFPWDELR
ncbi:kinase-like protein [Cryphonectria parasitica EP155]|uniref:EKC/KEOPS complex subunit BUD32 n=1 Tax=Cryphonectria parasitica (strain ATCC 38755 / EP155) TaxID=660469 RepID=A0A9P4XZ70_CRYP1|nr:kinase-like protein [Cryphonectria parasitica EP155]KAF3764034.1 kinase-like protein [Cryphonectria parasitica EP155]